MIFFCDSSCMTRYLKDLIKTHNLIPLFSPLTDFTTRLWWKWKSWTLCGGGTRITSLTSSTWANTSISATISVSPLNSWGRLQQTFSRPGVDDRQVAVFLIKSNLRIWLSIHYIWNSVWWKNIKLINGQKKSIPFNFMIRKLRIQL